MQRWYGPGGVLEAGQTTVIEENVWFEDASKGIARMSPKLACPRYDSCKFSSKAADWSEAEWAYLQHLRGKSDAEKTQRDRARRIYPSKRMMDQLLIWIWVSIQSTSAKAL